MSVLLLSLPLVHLGLEYLPHAAYSTYLASSDYWLFREIDKAPSFKKLKEFSTLRSVVELCEKGTPGLHLADGGGWLLPSLGSNSPSLAVLELLEKVIMFI